MPEDRCAAETRHTTNNFFAEGSCVMCDWCLGRGGGREGKAKKGQDQGMYY